MGRGIHSLKLPSLPQCFVLPRRVLVALVNSVKVQELAIDNNLGIMKHEYVQYAEAS